MSALSMYSKMLCNMMTLLFIRWVNGELGKLFSFSVYSLSFSYVSIFIIGANSDHDILELYLRKIFFPYENVHYDNHCQSAKLRSILGRMQDIEASNIGDWQAKTLNLNGDTGQPSLVSRYWGVVLLIIPR